MDKMTRKQVNSMSRKRRKKWTIRIVSLIAVLVIGFIIYNLVHLAMALSKSSDSSVGGSHLRSTPVHPKTEPFAILLIGTDATNLEVEKKEGWRSDVLMVLAVNPKTKTAKLLSIPRDTLVPIANTHGFKDKINSAATYARLKGLNQVDNVRQTVEDFTGIPIDYYAKVNFQGFADIVDAVGGVDVHVSYAFPGPAIHKIIQFKPGDYHLNGMEALAYVRQRHYDPKGDIGRNQRQQEVISQIIDKMMSINGVTKFSDVVDAVGKNFSYNIPFTDLPSVFAVYNEIPKKNIERIELQTTSHKLPYGGNMIWFEICSPQEHQRIKELLRQQMEWNGSAGSQSNTKKTTKP